jgi:hypothetical protein
MNIRKVDEVSFRQFYILFSMRYRRFMLKLRRDFSS